MIKLDEPDRGPAELGPRDDVLIVEGVVPPDFGFDLVGEGDRDDDSVGGAGSETFGGPDLIEGGICNSDFGGGDANIGCCGNGELGAVNLLCGSGNAEVGAGEVKTELGGCGNGILGDVGRDALGGGGKGALGGAADRLGGGT